VNIFIFTQNGNSINTFFGTDTVIINTIWTGLGEWDSEKRSMFMPLSIHGPLNEDFHSPGKKKKKNF
jgi:hypothetical protein